MIALSLILQTDTAFILSWVMLGIGVSVASGIFDRLRRTKTWSIALRVSAIILLSAILLPSISDADEIAAFSYLGGPSRTAGQTGTVLSESSQEDSENHFAGFCEFLEHQNLARLWSQLAAAILWFLSISAIRGRIPSIFAESSPDRAPPESSISMA